MSAAGITSRPCAVVRIRAPVASIPSKVPVRLWLPVRAVMVWPSRAARASQAVQEYLVARGVEGGRISTVSYGRERPLEACATEICFARNRRAVTAVTVAPAV